MPPSAAELQCPGRLRGDARAEWNRLATNLETAGVLTMADLEHFADYCFVHGQVRQLERLVGRVGMVKAIAKGYTGQLLKIRQQRRQLAMDLGLTPASRSQVKAAPRGGRSLNRHMEAERAERQRDRFFR